MRIPDRFNVKVVGVSFRPAYPDNLWALDEAWQQFEHQGDEPLAAVLVREPDNTHDPNAVAVHVPALGDDWAHIGYIMRPVAERLAPEMDAGAEWSGEVVSVLINPEFLDRPGIEIRCTRVHQEETA